jgi:acyl-coenzyme A synthetase/AMP-(fatty) acid ligase
MSLVIIDRLPDEVTDTNPDVRCEPDDYAYIVYTSGSTGDPKGVIENHRDVKWFTGWFISSDKITQADVQTGFTSLAFSGLAAAIYVTLLGGAKTLLLDPQKVGVDRLLDLMRAYRVTHISVLPSLFRRIKNSDKFADGWPAIRLGRFGGSAVSGDDIRDFFKWAHNAQLRHSLGMSEVKHICSYLFSHADSIPDAGVPVGYESDGLEVMLLDEDGAEVSTGAIGEIVVKGAFISPGYWKLPHATTQTIYGQPNGQPDRYMRTGDLGVRDENGCLYHKGRKDFQVKVKGYRIELEEVEVAVRNTGGVADAAVGVSALESSDYKLVAVFVPNEDFKSTSMIRRSVARTLPFQMVPTIYIEAEEIPTTSTGKIDRLELARFIGRSGL